MTFATPTDLSTLRAGLRERCQLDVNDPRGTDAKLTSLINAALHRFSVANPFSWTWETIESTGSMSSGSERVTVTFDQWMKVRYIIVVLSAGGAFPLERVSRYEQLDRYPSDAETKTPTTFSILGGPSLPSYYLRFRPVPDADYTFIIGGIRQAANLAANSDPALPNDLMIEEWADVVLEYAAFLVYRGRGALSEAMTAHDAFANEVMRLRRRARRMAGPGIGQRSTLAGWE